MQTVERRRRPRKIKMKTKPMKLFIGLLFAIACITRCGNGDSFSSRHLAFLLGAIGGATIQVNGINLNKNSMHIYAGDSVQLTAA